MSTNALPVPFSAGSSRVLGFAGTVGRRIAELAQAYRHRKDLSMLASFDDRMLADIGLTRGDVRDAVAQPLWRDPTAVLVNRAGERRRAQLRLVNGDGRRLRDAPPTVPEVEDASNRLFPARSRYY